MGLFTNENDKKKRSNNEPDYVKERSRLLENEYWYEDNK